MPLFLWRVLGNDSIGRLFFDLLVGESECV